MNARACVCVIKGGIERLRRSYFTLWVCERETMSARKREFSFRWASTSQFSDCVRVFCYCTAVLVSCFVVVDCETHWKKCNSLSEWAWPNVCHWFSQLNSLREQAADTFSLRFRLHSICFCRQCFFFLFVCWHKLISCRFYFYATLFIILCCLTLFKMCTHFSLGAECSSSRA